MFAKSYILITTIGIIIVSRKFKYQFILFTRKVCSSDISHFDVDGYGNVPKVPQPLVLQPLVGGMLESAYHGHVFTCKECEC